MREEGTPVTDPEAPVQVERARAKLTLSLRVTGRRSDGYHLVDAEMVTIDLADTLTFSRGDGLEVVRAAGNGDGEGEGDGEGGEGTGAGDTPAAPAGDDNLVVRALVAVHRKAHVRLVKAIPVGAGLGGGSADAAAVLRWAGCVDVARAAALGADVAFCLVGGRARVRGIGERIEALEPVSRTFTLLTPPFGCSTAAVYRAWDDLGGRSADGPNDLEPAALTVEPRLALWRDRLGDATGQTPLLAGSGSTYFVTGAFPGTGRVVTHATEHA